MLKVQAPRLTLLSNYPVAAERADLLQDGWEVLWIPVASTSQVRVEVLHPLLRWPFGLRVAALSLWSPLNWIFLGFGVIFSKRIQENVLEPLTSPILGLFRRKKRRASFR